MIELRPYQVDDAKKLLALFRHTIRTISTADYDSAQISAWSSDEININDWQNRFNDRFAYVALLDGTIVGFADMTFDGYLDRLFVSADHQRRGIATALLTRIKSDARKTNLKEITTQASITAKPFFESAGFVVLKQQSVECRGAILTNYRMRYQIHDL